MAIPSPVAIATPWYKFVAFFGAGKWGWTETLYLGNVAGGGSETQLRGLAVDYSAVRIPLLGANARMEAVRFELLDGQANPKRVSEITFSPSLAFASGQNTLENQFFSPPWVSWLCRGNDPSLQFNRSFWIRGLPNDLVPFNDQNPIDATIPPALQAAWQAFKGFLTGAGQTSPPATWAIRGQVKDPGTNPPAAIVGVNQHPTANYQGYFMGTTLPSGIGIGDNIIVRKLKGRNLKGWNGRFKVVTIDTTQKIIYVNRFPLCVGPYQIMNPGEMVKNISALYAMNYLQIERIDMKKTGRAFFGTRGRQSSKLC